MAPAPPGSELLQHLVPIINGAGRGAGMRGVLRGASAPQLHAAGGVWLPAEPHGVTPRAARHGSSLKQMPLQNCHRSQRKPVTKQSSRMPETSFCHPSFDISSLFYISGVFGRRLRYFNGRFVFTVLGVVNTSQINVFECREDVLCVCIFKTRPQGKCTTSTKRFLWKSKGS